MPKALRVEDITQGAPREIGILRSTKMPVGRDPEFGLRVESPAVSRLHGEFVPIGNHWFFVDLASTNGSWINDRRVPAHTMKIVRGGDYLQLADSVVRLASIAQEPRDDDAISAEEIWSLVVFCDGEFKDEFPIPKSGKALIVGGKGADIQFSDESSGRKQEEPSAVFERRRDGLYVFQVDNFRPVSINDQVLHKSTKLEDNDIVTVDRFVILFNSPRAPKGKTAEWSAEEMNALGREQPPPVLERTIKSWGSDTGGEKEQNTGTGFAREERQRPAINPLFGQKPVREPEKAEEGPSLTSASPRDLNTTTTKIYSQGPIRRDPYQPAYQPEFEEEEGVSPYKILIVVFSALLIFLLIVVVSVLLR